MNISKSIRQRVSFAPLFFVLILSVSVLQAPLAGAQSHDSSVKLTDLNAYLMGFPLEPDANLQALFDKSIKANNLDKYIEKNELSVTLVDITDVNNPKLAHANGRTSFYAASLPKLAILLAVYEEAHLGNLELTPEINEAMVSMIRHSSNSKATYLYNLVGAERIAEILQSDRYKFYDEQAGGGLWVGKPYGKQGAWKRDPLTNFSHAANGLQVARFYYMLQRNELTDPSYCPLIKDILSDSAINHKFVKGLKSENPTAEIFRKSGTWRNYHSDSAIVESENGHTYIAVALSNTPNGGAVMEQVIKSMDRIIGDFHSAGL